MQPAPPTEHEELRLATLAAQQILDTAPDKRFDNIVHLAADMFDVPIALVSLVDQDRQWFKSAVGLQAGETPRDQAFCAHAILRPDDVMVVEDASQDPRFTENPLVRGVPGIRFYAGAPIRAGNGEALGTLCLIDHVPRSLTPAECARLQDLSRSVAAMVDLHRSALDLQRAASHDRLTGLANRAMFETRLDAALRDAMAGRPFGILLGNIDGFGDINEKHGHEIGDGVLVTVARRLAGAVRGADLVARTGGDEFGILLDGPIEGTTVAAVMRRMQDQVHPPIRIGGQSLGVHLSFGSALAPLDATDRRSLLRVAAAAVETAKRIGSPAILTSNASRPAEPAEAAPFGPGRAMEAALRRAMQTDELSLQWQPFFNTANGTVRGFEALLRWNHPVQGNISPGVFLPLAESSGLIAQLDSWVLRHACRAAAAWRGPYGIAVNLSAHWFSVGGVVERVGQALRESNLAPGRLEIELTERTVISSRDVARAQMASLRDMGVRLAMDDFGTGYSSLAYLRQFPFDKLKLDRAFVAPLGEDSKADAVARAIIRLGQALEMQVCAEGVETLAQLAFLRREGCDIAQGYLLGRPTAIPCTDPFPLTVGNVPHRLTKHTPHESAQNVVRLRDRAVGE